MSQGPIKVFIASSGEKKGIADALSHELKEQAKNYKLEVAPQVWRDIAVPGEDVFEALLAHCAGRPSDKIARSDFFVAILTPDDQGTKKGIASETPRDNCIFELGLFIGGLEFQMRRCFMLCSVEQADLPSDLAGRTYLHFDEPAEPTPKSHRDAVKDAAGTIVGQMVSMKSFRPAELSITSSDLMELERPRSEGGDLAIAADVLVNRSQPLEADSFEVAKMVNANLRAGITYRYFFHDLESMSIIARLIYRIATVPPSDSVVKIIGVVPEAQIIENLDLMANRLCIHFLPSNGPIEFCIHNSQTTEAACYLRFPFKDLFVPWCRNQSALHIARELLDMGERDEECDPSRVFRKTNLFDIKADQTRKDKLWFHLRKQFNSPAIEPHVRRICFGEKDS